MISNIKMLFLLYILLILELIYFIIFNKIQTYLQESYQYFGVILHLLSLTTTKYLLAQLSN